MQSLRETMSRAIVACAIATTTVACASSHGVQPDAAGPTRDGAEPVCTWNRAIDCECDAPFAPLNRVGVRLGVIAAREDGLWLSLTHTGGPGGWPPMGELLMIRTDGGSETVAEVPWSQGYFSSAFGEGRAILGFGGAAFGTPSSFLLVDLRDRRVVPMETEEPVRAVAIDEEHGLLALIASGLPGEERRAAFGVLDESGNVLRSTPIPGDTYVSHWQDPVHGPGRIGWIDIALAPQREVLEYDAVTGAVSTRPLAYELGPSGAYWVDGSFWRERVVVAASDREGPRQPVRISLDLGDGVVVPGSARPLSSQHHLAMTSWGDRLALAHSGAPPGAERGSVMLSILSADGSVREHEVRADLPMDDLMQVRVTPISESALAVAWTEPECSVPCEHAETYSIHVRVMCPDRAR